MAKNVASATLYFIPYRERPLKERPNIKGKTNRKGSCRSVSFVLETDYIHLKLAKWMKEFVCEKNSSGTSSPFMVTHCLGKFFAGINISRQHV